MIETTVIGPNSSAISFSGSDNITSIAAAIEVVVINKGWSLFDSVSSTQRVYRALCVDGIAYKYVCLTYDNSNIFIKVYESWNANTHVGINLCYLSDNNSFSMRLKSNSIGTIGVFVSTRWLILMSTVSTYIGSESGSSFSGCVEVSRDNPLDTATFGLPPYIWINGYKAADSNSNVVSFPRLYTGATGNDASKDTFISNGISLGGSDADTGKTQNQELGKSISTGKIIWSNKNFAFTLIVGKIVDPTACDIRGRLYGLKLLTKGIGMYLDTVSVLVDSDYFYNSNGILTTHIILPTSTSTCFCIPA